MTDKAPSLATKSDKLRYRAYFWAMSASFAAIVIGLTSEVFEAFTGYEAFGMPYLPKVIIGIFLGILAIILPIFLMAVPYWRDEYADMIWKRSVGVLVLLFAIAPPLIFLGLWIAWLAIGGETRPDWLAWLFDEQRPIDILLRSFYVFTSAFVVIFQLIRWWESR